MHHNNRSIFGKSVLLAGDSCVLLALQKIAYYKLHELLDYRNPSHLSLKSRNNQQVHAKVRVKQTVLTYSSISLRPSGINKRRVIEQLLQFKCFCEHDSVTGPLLFGVLACGPAGISAKKC